MLCGRPPRRTTFESVLLAKCVDYLDDLQFGFKRATGCFHAVFTLRTVVDYFTSRGSTVYAAALDISKAFDTVCHTKLLKTLWNAGVPGWIILVLND